MNRISEEMLHNYQLLAEGIVKPERLRQAFSETVVALREAYTHIDRVEGTWASKAVTVFVKYDHLEKLEKVAEASRLVDNCYADNSIAIAKLQHALVELDSENSK